MFILWASETSHVVKASSEQTNFAEILENSSKNINEFPILHFPQEDPKNSGTTLPSA